MLSARFRFLCVTFIQSVDVASGITIEVLGSGGFSCLAGIIGIYTPCMERSSQHRTAIDHEGLDNLLRFNNTANRNAVFWRYLRLSVMFGLRWFREEYIRQCLKLDTLMRVHCYSHPSWISLGGVNAYWLFRRVWML
ncbi:hypothetical protein CVT26_013406 [Gymnopilus dilepis]|uniref:Uncharacterized protein n=1 Tax=Gymnopilus dilepis TaxID=231916 RepID=A0A409VV45_9AGAR|nr:hypothetical protein CVT26_013406 [Gymnopilus dilepis]